MLSDSTIYGDAGDTISLGLTSSPEASLAKIFLPPASGPESTESGLVYGRRCGESFASFDRDSSLWRTSQLCFTGAFAEFLETWPRAGTTRNGIAYRRPPLVPRTSATEFGLLPTPRSPKYGHDMAKFKREPSRRNVTDLETYVYLWPTPNATDGSKAPKFFAGGNPSLPYAVKLWPTPHGFSKDGRSNGPSGNELGRAVNRALLPTPTRRDYRSVGTPERLARARQKSSRGQPLTEIAGGSLNPMWVEWLMGYPLGWTDLKDSEMPSSRKSRSGSGKE